MAGTNRSGRRGSDSGSVGRASVGSAPVSGSAAGASRPRKKKRSTIPRWARVCTILGAVLMVVSGGLLVTSEALLARYEGAVAQEDLFGDGQVDQPADIEGPLNILLVGIDPRDSESLPLADSIMILHVPATHDRAYLFSLPRDLVVEIPAFKPADFNGGTGKLNAAMMYGSRVAGGGKPDRARGFELLSKTITRYTGIARFDAGAIVNFNGFKKIVDAMGGVTMYIDQDVESEHLQPNGDPRPNNGSGSAHPYSGPQAEYKKGTRHLKGWQALDYVRQRYGLPKGDYDRQRHQQQFVRAMAKQALSAGVVTNPIKLDKVLRAAGQAVVFNGRGRKITDFGWALRNLREDSIMMVKLRGRRRRHRARLPGRGAQRRARGRSSTPSAPARSTSSWSPTPSWSTGRSRTRLRRRGAACLHSGQPHHRKEFALAKPLQVELVAVEEKIWSGEAEMVVARTTEGELGVLPGHAPLLGQLAEPGEVRIKVAGGEQLTYEVTGGFVSVTGEGVTILAEEATPADASSR